jgi:hypothetical protein
MTGTIHYPPEQGAVQEVIFTKFFQIWGKNHKYVNQLANQDKGQEKKVQLNEENLDEAEDTTLRIICVKLFAEGGSEEELTVQLDSFL